MEILLQVDLLETVLPMRKIVVFWGKKTKQWSKSMESMVLYPNEAQHGGYIDE